VTYPIVLDYDAAIFNPLVAAVRREPRAVGV
jgi:hypothetical protein